MTERKNLIGVSEKTKSAKIRLYLIQILRSLTCLVTITLACGSGTEKRSNYAFRSIDMSE